MKLSVSASYASRSFLDGHPMIEDLLVYMVFKANYGILWVSDESNLFHFDTPEGISASLLEVFNIRVDPREIEKPYATIGWLEQNFSISSCPISGESDLKLKKVMNNTQT